MTADELRKMIRETARADPFTIPADQVILACAFLARESGRDPGIVARLEAFLEECRREVADLEGES